MWYSEPLLSSLKSFNFVETLILHQVFGYNSYCPVQASEGFRERKWLLAFQNVKKKKRERETSHGREWFLPTPPGFPGGTVVKNLLPRTGDREDVGPIPGSGRSPGEGNHNPFQSSCLENSMDRRAQKTTVHGVAKSWPQLSKCTRIPPYLSTTMHPHPLYAHTLSITAIKQASVKKI